MGKAKFMTSSSSFPNSWASARARGSTWPSGCRTERFALNRLTRVSPSRCRRASKPSVRSSPNSARWDRHHRHRRDRQRRKSATRADDRTLSVGDVRCVSRALPAPCTSLWRAWPRSLLAQAQLQRESTDPMRWHESFSGSIRARRPDRQPALPRVLEGSRRTARLRRTRCGFQSSMADNRQGKGQGRLGAEGLRSLNPPA